MRRQQCDVSEQYLYNQFPAADGKFVFHRCFGIEHIVCDGKHLKFSGPVARRASPWRWDAYTGRPRFVCEELWLLRAFALALGSVDVMESGLKSRVHDLEGQHEWQYYSVETSPGCWEYILHLKPEALPVPAIWFAVCVTEPERVCEIAQCIYKERSSAGLAWVK